MNAQPFTENQITAVLTASLLDSNAERDTPQPHAEYFASELAPLVTRRLNNFLPAKIGVREAFAAATASDAAEIGMPVMCFDVAMIGFQGFTMAEYHELALEHAQQVRTSQTYGPGERIPNVRVEITAATPPETALRALRRIVASLEDNPGLLTFAEPVNRENDEDPGPSLFDGETLPPPSGSNGHHDAEPTE